MKKKFCFLRFTGILAGFLLGGFSCLATIPSAENILSDDTLVLVTAPDFTKLRDIYRKSPQSQLWNDPAMKPFRDKLIAKVKEELLSPLERELGIVWDDYAGLAQGQVSFAMTQNGWPDKENQSAGYLLLMDSQSKSNELKKNLVALRKKWTDSGKKLKTENIRGIEFLIFAVAPEDLPKALRKIFGADPEPADASSDEEPKKKTRTSEIVIGQFESLLIIGNSLKPVEKVAVRLTGGSAPALGDLASYHANQLALFRDKPLYGWANAKALVNIFSRKPPGGDAEAAPSLLSIQTDIVSSGAGFAGLKTIALTFSDSNEGLLTQIFLGVPESGRQGIFKILTGEAKDSSPPVFVPADAVKFVRWRLDGQKTWASLEKIFSEVSPIGMNGINFLIDTANAAARAKDPDYDFRKNLIGNLGDDMIRYAKAAKGTTLVELDSPPSILLIGSPNSGTLASALKGIFLLISPQGGTPTEREFLGRTIHSVTIPGVLTGFPVPGQPMTRTLNYAASGGYVGITTDISLLEEYLRSSENSPKALRETPGFTEAMSKVTGLGTSLFGFANQTESMRVKFEKWKKTAANPPKFSPMPESHGISEVADPDKLLKEWLDYTILPDFDKVSKYFSFIVYGCSANMDGLTIKIFSPVPTQLRK